MASSVNVNAGDTILASHFNNLRSDVVNVSTSHFHTEAANDGQYMRCMRVINSATYTSNGGGADVTILGSVANAQADCHYQLVLWAGVGSLGSSSIVRLNGDSTQRYAASSVASGDQYANVQTQNMNTTAYTIPHTANMTNQVVTYFLVLDIVAYAGVLTMQSIATLSRGNPGAGSSHVDRISTSGFYNGASAVSSIVWAMPGVAHSYGFALMRHHHS